MGSILDQADRRYLRHARDAFPDLEHLFDVGSAVQELVDHPGWDHVMSVLDREVRAIDRRLDTAEKPHTESQYALDHGRRDGLRGARVAAEAILLLYLAKLDEQRRKHEGDAELSPEGS